MRVFFEFKSQPSPEKRPLEHFFANEIFVYIRDIYSVYSSE